MFVLDLKKKVLEEKNIFLIVSIHLAILLTSYVQIQSMRISELALYSF